MIEIEQKFIIVDESKTDFLLSIIKDLGFHEQTKVNQEDIYWDTKDLLITKLKRGLRTRYVDGTLHDVELKSLFMTPRGKYFVEEVSLQDSRGNIDSVRLDEVLSRRFGLKVVSPISSTNIRDVLASYDLTPEIVLNKTRTTYIDDAANSEICYDVIEGISPHIEIELKGEDVKSYESIVESIIKRADGVIVPTAAGYLDLITKQRADIPTKEEFNKQYELDSQWNVLEGEKHIVATLIAG